MKKKIIFMGTPSYATEIFKELLANKNYEVVAIFTQEDKPVGRKQVLTPPDIKQYCLENAQIYLDSGKLEIRDNTLFLSKEGIFISDGIMSDLLWVED